jgi:hypothetical protein
MGDVGLGNIELLSLQHCCRGCGDIRLKLVTTIPMFEKKHMIRLNYFQVKDRERRNRKISLPNTSR